MLQLIVKMYKSQLIFVKIFFFFFQLEFMILDKKSNILFFYLQFYNCGDCTKVHILHICGL